MYGLVNNAIHDFVLQNQGEETWLQIKSQAGIELESFNSMQSYDDSITYDLVGAASHVLEIEPEIVLEEFGKYWVSFAAMQEGHSHYFRLGDEGLHGFLKNLDRMHLNIARTYSELAPPSFQSNQIEKGHLELKYFSDRPGLRPFVKGLLLGLGMKFEIEVAVDIDPRTDEELGGFSLFTVKHT